MRYIATNAANQADEAAETLLLIYGTIPGKRMRQRVPFLKIAPYQFLVTKLGLLRHDYSSFICYLAYYNNTYTLARLAAYMWRGITNGVRC